MEPQQTVITNLPVWTMWVIAIAQIFFALAVFAIAVVLAKLVALLVPAVKTVNRHLPRIMMNAETISDDAQGTVRNVSGSVNRVSGVVDKVTEHMESPLIKTIGIAAGVAAGAKTMFGKKKKKRGFFGRR